MSRRTPTATSGNQNDQCSNHGMCFHSQKNVTFQSLVYAFVPIHFFRLTDPITWVSDRQTSDHSPSQPEEMDQNHP